MEKLNTISEAEEFINSQNLQLEDINYIIKESSLDAFSKTLLCIVKELPLENLIPQIIEHPNLINIWNETYFKYELLKSPKDYIQSASSLLKKGERELKEELDDDRIIADYKLDLLASIGKIPDFKTPALLDSTFDKDVAEFLLSPQHNLSNRSSTQFELDLLRIKLENDVKNFNYIKEIWGKVLPFLEEEVYRKAFFDYSSLRNYKELPYDFPEIRQKFKEDLLSKNGEETVFSWILAEDTEYFDFDAILTDFETMHLAFGSYDRRQLMNDFFPHSFYEEGSKKKLEQLLAINFFPEVTLKIKDSKVEISLNQKSDKALSQFFMNTDIRLASIVKQRPMSSHLDDDIVSLFTGQENNESMYKTFENMFSDDIPSKKELKIMAIKEHIFLVLFNFQELFSISLPKIEGYTNFQLLNFDESKNVINADFIIDNHNISLRKEEDRLNLVFNEGEDSLFNTETLMERLTNFTNNMNAFLEEN